MVWFVTVVVVLVLAGVVAVATGVGGAMGDVERLPGQRLPERELEPADLRHARFEMVLRGYRPDEVDALLDRVADEWQARLDAVAPAPVAVPADTVEDPAGNRAGGRAEDDGPGDPASRADGA